MAEVTITEVHPDNIEHWRALCPSLNVEGDLTREAYAIGDMGELLNDLRIEGYVNVPGVLPTSVFEPLRDCLSTLQQVQIPLAFSFVYDEMWLAFQGVARFISAALGEDYRALPDFWAWHVPATDQGAGWGPHRDKPLPTLDADNSPHSLTVWLPFSDATPLNGCMHVLPAHRDERFQRREWGGPDNNRVFDPQSIRALPAPAGSMLAWNQALLHWGGRASRLAKGPRASAAFEFQRGDKPAYNVPLLDPGRMPSFEERLGLIGKQVLQYRHMYPLAPEVEQIALALFQRFMPADASAQPTVTQGNSVPMGAGGPVPVGATQAP